MKIVLSCPLFSLFGFLLRLKRLLSVTSTILVATALGLSITVMSGQSISLLPPELTFDGNGVINNPGWAPHLYTNHTDAGRASTIVSLERHGHEWLGIQRTSTNSNNSGQLMYTQSQLADFSGSVILGSSSWNATNDAIGLILRGQGPTFANANSYYLAVNNAGLTLYYGLANNFTSQTSDKFLVNAALPEGVTLGTLTTINNNQYRLEFSFIGREVSASLYAIQEGGEDSLLSELLYTDNRDEFREEGWFGLRGGRFGGERNALFRDLHISTIPEPGVTVLSALLGMGAVLFWQRRRKQ